jgi:hypothetical protein
MTAIKVKLNEGCYLVNQSEQAIKSLDHWKTLGTQSPKVKVERNSKDEIYRAKREFKSANPDYGKRSKNVTKISG